MATVSPIPNGGTVTFKEGTSTLGTDLVDGAGQATCTINYLALGDRTITAEYSGTGLYDASTSNSLIQEVKRASIVTVFCADTPLIVNTTATGTVTIIGLPEGGSIPTGRVNLSHTGNGTLSPGHWILVTGDAGQFEFTYIPDDADGNPHVITASYVGDSEHVAGSDTFNQAIVKRAVDIQLSCSPVTAYVGQEVTVTVHVEDDTTEGTPGDLDGEMVTLSTTSATGWFESDAPGDDYDATLNSSGNCTVTYTPGAGEAGTTTITATYVESLVYTSKSSTQQLTVELRPTETSVDCVASSNDHAAMLVNETGTCTVTVKDSSGVAIPSGWPDGPVGTVKITSSLETAGMGNIFPAEITYPAVAPSGGESQISFNYGCTSLVNDADFDTIGGIYTSVGGIYTDSAGGYAQAIYRRPTETTVVLTATDTGYSAQVFVVEQSGLAGTATATYGDILVKTDDDGDGALEETIKCSSNFYNIIPCAFIGSTDAIIVNIGVFYEPGDGVHLKSAGSEYVTREDAPNLPSG
ncbi:Ig-like domain repeat protein, partial [Candidatus Bipolaricaulota bacterium]|nr:Ig-like domain repeat protein [Candidatus Bipolaricaulota bacterium]